MSKGTTKLDEILETFRAYQDVPNVPFLSRFTTSFVKHYLDAVGIRYEENKYGIAINPAVHDKGKQNLLIISHLDHPGIVLRNNHRGIFMGLIGTKALQNEVLTNKIPIKLFNPQGKYIGKGNIVNVDPSFKQRIEITTDVMVPTNSFGQFDIDYYSQSGDTIYAYNADDGIAVAIMLQVLKDMKDVAYNVHFLFTSIEEVHQLSSWFFAKTNYFNLGEGDIILNLECLKVENISSSISNANYDDGVVLQLSNTGCLFGYRNNGDNNAIQLVEQAAALVPMKIQRGLIKDSCDSRPFTQFALTPNIATLTIPNKYKHNGADDGKITAEVIKTRDIEDLYTLLSTCVKTQFVDKKTDVSRFSELKVNDTITDRRLMLEKMLLNERLEIAYHAAVARRHYYPENFTESLLDLLLKVASYIRYYVTRTLGLRNKLV